MNNDITSMMVHKVREQELIKRAENERTARDARTQNTPARRHTIRINNNPVR